MLKATAHATPFLGRQLVDKVLIRGCLSAVRRPPDSSATGTPICSILGYTWPLCAASRLRCSRRSAGRMGHRNTCAITGLR